VQSATLKKKKLNLQEDQNTLAPPDSANKQLVRNQTVVIQSEQNSPVMGKGGYFGSKSQGLESKDVKK